MIKANSLLYAVYVCVVVALLCGAMLYVASLYGQLNTYYNVHEELYIQNQSAVNYALANMPSPVAPEDEDSNTITLYEIKQHGILPVLLTSVILNTDTVKSAHFTGIIRKEKMCLYLTDFSTPLSYSGDVILEGEASLPSENIRKTFLLNRPSTFRAPSVIHKSGRMLPQINRAIIESASRIPRNATQLAALYSGKDSIQSNSFFAPVREISAGKDIENITLKGNFVIYAADSLTIRKSAHLEDIVIYAGQVMIEDGFRGKVQVFASKTITTGNNVILEYPSVMCLYNDSETDGSAIKLGENNQIQGGIFSFGYPVRNMGKNTVEIGNLCKITGDIYCQGRLSLKGKVIGSVYTNKLLFRSGTSEYENCLADAEINAIKVPAYFVGLPLFNNKGNYATIRRVM